MIAIIFRKNNNLFLMNGYSGMWLTILYIIGAYLGKYIIKFQNKHILIHCIFYIFIYIFSSFISSEIKFKLIKIKSKIPNNILINFFSFTKI